MIESKSTDLVRHASAKEIVGCRDEALRMYREAFELLHKAKEMTKRASGSNYCGADLGHMSFYNIERGEFDKDMEDVRKRVDSGVWEYMLDAVGLKAMMDASALAEFRKQNEKDPPEVTLDNLAATMEHLDGQRVTIFDRGVVNLFSRLDHTFKTNPSFRLEKKIILSGVLGSYGGWNFYGRGVDEVRDLDRIFHLLDGKAPKDHIADASAVIGQARGRKGGQQTVETDYFTFRLMGNGNLHIVFKRPDLVDGVNRIIAAHFGATLGHDRRKQAAA
jgi:hypothetical protein